VASGSALGLKNVQPPSARLAAGLIGASQHREFSAGQNRLAAGFGRGALE